MHDFCHLKALNKKKLPLKWSGSGKVRKHKQKVCQCCNMIGRHHGIVYSLQYALVRAINVRTMPEKPEGETVDNRMRTWK